MNREEVLKSTDKEKNVKDNSLADMNISEAQIDAEAAAILHSATQAVKAILARREELDREGRQDEPLIVIAGESHNIPAHQLHHMLVLEGLKKSGEKTILGYEQEHDLLAQQFFKAVKKKPDPVISKDIKQQDKNGQKTLLCFSAIMGSTFADHSAKILFRYLRRNSRISFRFTDAARSGDYLDMNDPSTAESSRFCLRIKPKEINTVLPEGMQIRNHHMSRMMTGFARETKARIAIQQCGAAHVMGEIKYNSKAIHSLTACFKKQNIPVLAMPLMSKTFTKKDIPQDHGLSAQEQLFYTTLPDKTAVYSPSKSKDQPGLRDEFLRFFRISFGADFKYRAAESAYINALLKRVGLQKECMSVQEYRKEQSSLTLDLSVQFILWRQKHLSKGPQQK